MQFRRVAGAASALVPALAANAGAATDTVTTEAGASMRYARVTVAESLPLALTLRFHRIDSEAR